MPPSSIYNLFSQFLLVVEKSIDITVSYIHIIINTEIILQLICLIRRYQGWRYCLRAAGNKWLATASVRN
jgi:hypothetical protein